MRIVQGYGVERASIDAHLDRFDETVLTLLRGGEMQGIAFLHLPENLAGSIEAVRQDMADFRADANAILDGHAKHQDVTGAVAHLHTHGDNILHAADRISANLTAEIAVAESKAVRSLYGLALLDMALFILAL